MSDGLGWSTPIISHLTLSITTGIDKMTTVSVFTKSGPMSTTDRDRRVAVNRMLDALDELEATDG